MNMVTLVRDVLNTRYDPVFGAVVTKVHLCLSFVYFDVQDKDGKCMISADDKYDEQVRDTILDQISIILKDLQDQNQRLSLT